MFYAVFHNNFTGVILELYGSSTEIILQYVQSRFFGDAPYAWEGYAVQSRSLNAFC